MALVNAKALYHWSSSSNSQTRRFASVSLPMIQSRQLSPAGRPRINSPAMTPDKNQSDMRSALIRAVLQGMLAGLLLGIGFATGYLFRDRFVQPPKVETSYALLQEADALMAQHFLYEVPAESVRVHGAVQGLIASYNDPYTFFVEPQSAEVDAGGLAGRFGGIGAEIGQDANGS